MDPAPNLIDQAIVWLTGNAAIAVAVGSSLLSALLLYLDSRWPEAREAAAEIEPGAPVSRPSADVAEASSVEAIEEAADISEVTTEIVPAHEMPPLDLAPVEARFETVEAEAASPEPEPEPVRVSLRERLSKTSQNLVGRLGRVLGTGTVDQDVIDELEALLFTADLGVATAEDLLESVKRGAMGRDASEARAVLRNAIVQKLAKVDAAEPIELNRTGPHVILVLGVNGSGKTTTIGKLAAQYTRAGKKVVLGAGDTFRAAAAEQLQVWGERSGSEVIRGKEGGDPASVAFDAVKAAIARGADLCIIDTAGRLQTKKPLMEELAKINRIISRDLPGAPHECLLVLDSNTGQNAISQAELFTEVANVTGLVLTKLDGTAKGGVIVGLADRFAIPVRYVGVGEGVDDLRAFHAEEFVDALFEVG